MATTHHLKALLAGAVGIGGLLPVVVGTPALADTPLPEECTTTTYDGFGGASDLTVNGHAAVVTSADGQVLRVTPAAFSRAGSAFTTNKVSLANDGSFSTAFSFRFSNQLGGGADGLVFTVQNVANNVGGIGGGIGYQGLSPSIGVEFDNWDNGSVDGFSNNHVGIDVNGSINSVARATLAPIDLDDPSAVHQAWVDYDGTTNTLEVRVADSTTRPATAILSHTVDLPALLGGSGSPVEDAFVGFTSGTGGAAANHDVIGWTFSNCYRPVGVDASPTAEAGGPYSGSKSVALPLDGEVNDDQPGVTQAWTWSGPTGASCTIGDPSAEDTSITCDRSGTYTLGLTATDSIGQTAQDTAQLTISNQAPVAGALQLSATGACTVDATLQFTDADTGDTHTASFDWGDSTTSAGTVDETAGTATDSHTYAAAGTYTVTGSIDDGEDSDSTSASYATKNTAGAFLAPINASGTRSVFRKGSTIPVKIVIRDCDGAVVDTLTPGVQLEKLDGVPLPATNELQIDEAATNGRQMFWAGDHYHFNLSTKNSQFAGGGDLVAGSYRISVTDPSLAAPASVVVDLR